MFRCLGLNQQILGGQHAGENKFGTAIWCFVPPRPHSAATRQRRCHCYRRNCRKLHSSGRNSAAACARKNPDPLPLPCAHRCMTRSFSRPPRSASTSCFLAPSSSLRSPVCPPKSIPSAGGAFTTFGKLIEGRNIELVPNQRIVQAWRPASWEPGLYSIVRFELKPRQLRNHHRPRPHRFPGRRLQASRMGMAPPLLGTAQEILRLAATREILGERATVCSRVCMPKRRLKRVPE